MSLLLPRTVPALVRRVQPVDIHGDRYVDVILALDEAPDAPLAGRVGASDCPAGLAAGERVLASFTMGVLVRLARPVT